MYIWVGTSIREVEKRWYRLASITSGESLPSALIVDELIGDVEDGIFVYVRFP